MTDHAEVNTTIYLSVTTGPLEARKNVQYTISRVVHLMKHVPFHQFLFEISDGGNLFTAPVMHVRPSMKCATINLLEMSS